MYVIHSIKGRVRLRVPRFKSGFYEPRGLQALLTVQPGIIDANVNERCRSVTIVYDPASWTAESLCGWLQGRRRNEFEEHTVVASADIAEDDSWMNWLQPWGFSGQRENTPCPKTELQASQSGKSGYLTVGYVSLAVGSVLLPIPLVPGIPFLILSSYCFAKAAMSQDEKRTEPEKHVPDKKT